MKQILLQAVTTALIISLLSGCGESAGGTSSTGSPSSETSSAVLSDVSSSTASTGDVIAEVPSEPSVVSSATPSAKPSQTLTVTATPIPAATPEPVEISHVFALSVGEGLLSQDTRVFASKFTNPSVFGLETMAEYQVLSNAKQTISSPFSGNETFTYEKSKCTFKDSKENEYGGFYSVYDTYTNAAGERVEMLHGTDIVGFYDRNSTERDPMGAVTTIDETKAKQIADEFLGEILPEEYRESLVYTGTSYDERFNTWRIGYHTVIEGYTTDDDQIVYLDGDGEVDGYHGYDTLKYETLKDDITVEKLDAAKAALEEKITSDSTGEIRMGEPWIVTNTSGDPYLLIGFSYAGSTNVANAFTAYTNIL